MHPHMYPPKTSTFSYLCIFEVSFLCIPLVKSYFLVLTLLEFSKEIQGNTVAKHSSKKKYIFLRDTYDSLYGAGPAWLAGAKAIFYFRLFSSVLDRTVRIFPCGDLSTF